MFESFKTFKTAFHILIQRKNVGKVLEKGITSVLGVGMSAPKIVVMQ